jgi:hypothetical protein
MKIRTQADLDKALEALGTDWETAQKLVAPSLGLDPEDIGSLEEATVIVATAWADDALEDSRCLFCSSCHAAVSVTPTSANMLARRPEVRLLCLPCALDDVPMQKGQP